MVASGRDKLHAAIKTWGLPTKPLPERMTSPVVAVLAEGDYVVVSFVREEVDPTRPSARYTITWFDMWRFVDGKADEHWDGAVLPARPTGS